MAVTHRVIAAVICALLTGCGGSFQLGFWDTPPGKKIIGDVEFHGNDEISSGAIEDRLHTHSDNWTWGAKPLYDPTDVASDATRIESFYAAQGYFDAQVTKYWVEDIDDDVVRVHFRLKENKPTLVREIGFVGLDPAAAGDDDEWRERITGLEAEMREQIALRPQRRWQEVEHEEAKTRIRRTLLDRGFAWAEVFGEVRVARDAGRCDVVFRVVTGPLVRVGAVSVDGNDVISAERILRRSHLDEGVVADKDVRDRTRRDIYALGVFYSVHVEVVRPSIDEVLDGKPRTWSNISALELPAVLPLRIGVNETPMRAIKASLGLSAGPAESDIFVKAGFEHRNLFGGMRYLSIEAIPRYVWLPSPFTTNDLDQGPGFQLRTDFRQPSFFDEWLNLAIGLEYELKVEKHRRSHNLRGSLGFSRRLAEGLTARAGYTAEFISYFNVTDDLVSADLTKFGVEFRKQATLAYFEQALTLDLRDNPFDARRGVYVSLRAQEAHKYFGSSFDYIRLLADLRGFWTPWDFLTMGLRFRYGQAFPLSAGDIPLGARIYGGGATDMRGYGAQLMTNEPVCTDGDCAHKSQIVVGGNLALVASFETRWRLPWWGLGLVAFVDVGNVWSTMGDFDIADIDVAVGPGLRIDTPVGPIRADVGFLVRPFPPRLPKKKWIPEFHLSIGQAF